MPSIACPKCGVALPEMAMADHGRAVCSACGLITELFIFPAFYHPLKRGRTGEAVLAVEDAGCFFHPGKKAETLCAECGRFLCALCDLELDGRHLCPQCLNSVRAKGGVTALETRRTLHNRAAMMAGWLPMLAFFAFPILLVTGPAAIVLGILGLRRPNSLLGQRKWEAVLGIAGGCVQLLGVVGFFIAIGMH